MSGDSYRPGDRDRSYNAGHGSYHHGSDSYRPYDSSERYQRGYRHPPPPGTESDRRDFSFKGAARASDHQPYQFRGRDPPGPNGFVSTNGGSGPSHDFDFRPQNFSNAPSFPAGDPHSRDTGRANRQGKDRPRYGKNPNRRNGWKPPPGASDRALMRAHRSVTPEQLKGMNQGESRFKILEDLSDESGEESEGGASMDTSDSADDADGAVKAKANGDDGAEASDDEEHPRAKRARVASPDAESAFAPARPQWSNPDPYTALPPPSESHPRGKDVLSLIRKAKVEGQNNAEKATASDFISLNFDDDQQDEDRESSPEVQEVPAPRASFSHLNNLHPDRQVSDPTPPPPKDMPPKPPSALDVWPPPAVENGTGDGFGRAIQRQENAASATQQAPKANRKRKYEPMSDLGHVWQPLSEESSAPWHTRGHAVGEGANADLW